MCPYGTYCIRVRYSMEIASVEGYNRVYVYYICMIKVYMSGMFYQFLLASMSIVKDSLQHSQNSPYKFLMCVPLH